MKICSIKRYGPKAEKNARWNGGISQYPNHYEMKQIRKLKIKDSNGKCVVCGKKPKIIHIHHIDGSKDNHVYDNLLACCTKCAMKFHKGQCKISKMRKLYGYTFRELTIKFGASGWKYQQLHKKGQLHDFLWRYDINAPFYPLEMVEQAITPSKEVIGDPSGPVVSES